MAIPEERLQELINAKDVEAAGRSVDAHGYVEAWAIIDGALVIHDLDSPPIWLEPVLDSRDDDGNTLT